MFKSISNWWNKDKIALQAEVEQLKRDKDVMNDTHDEIYRKRDAEMDALILERDSAFAELEQFKQIEKAKQDGIDPWLRIETARHDKVRGLEVELDWNQALIEYLREAWEGPKDDRVMVQKYLAMLYEHLIERLEAQVVDDTDKHRVNDFEWANSDH